MTPSPGTALEQATTPLARTPVGVGGETAGRGLPLTGVLVLGTLYGVLAVRLHLTFRTAGWDLGIFEQAIRNYASFHAPVVVLKGPGYNLLGDHFHPILILLAPVYALFPSPITILLAQALLFAVAAWPLIAWAQRECGRAVAIAVGIVYGLSFGIVAAVSYDFHEIAFAVPLVAFSLSALGSGRLRTAAAFALPLILVKEDLGITVVAVIGMLIFFRGARRLGITLAMIGGFATLIEMFVILPAVNAGIGYHYLARLAAHPILTTFGTNAGEKFGTLILTVAITGCAALISPIALAAIPTLLWRFASNDANYWGTDYHYGAVLMPIMVAAMIDGIIRLRHFHPRYGRVFSRFAIVGALVVTAAAVPSHGLARLADPTLWVTTRHSEAITDALERIPAGVTVSASDDLIPHLTSRDTVTLFGLRSLASTEPDYIVVDPLSRRHFVVTRPGEHNDVLGAERAGYRVRSAEDGVILLQR